MASPRALMITGFGINCDYETGHALALPQVGFEVDACHLNDLLSDPSRLDPCHLLVIPGGFSYGDHISSGRVLGNRLRTHLQPALDSFLAAGKLVLGICNGFQVLVKMGLLPALGPETPAYWQQQATLTRNNSGRFEDRWVNLQVRPGNPCVFLRELENLYLPIRHGEGKLVFAEGTLDRVRESAQDVLRYADTTGQPTSTYPANPNGSEDNLAGLCDPTGRVFGLMPHPEAFLHHTNHPTWTRLDLPEEGQGTAIFRNAADFVRGEL